MYDHICTPYYSIVFPPVLWRSCPCIWTVGPILIIMPFLAGLGMVALVPDLGLVIPTPHCRAGCLIARRTQCRTQFSICLFEVLDCVLTGIACFNPSVALFLEFLGLCPEFLGLCPIPLLVIVCSIYLLLHIHDLLVACLLHINLLSFAFQQDLLHVALVHLLQFLDAIPT